MRLGALASACLLVTSLDAVSGAAPGDSGADPVVLSVGSSEVRRSELTFLLGRLHEFERRSFGNTPAEARRGFVDRRLVPELLVTEEARRLRSAEQPGVAGKLRGALGQALKEELERTIDATLTRAELEAYCQSEGGQRPDAGEPGPGAPTCSGDLSGHRVTLRRLRASEEQARIAARARDQAVKGVDYALLDSITVDARGTSAAAPASKSQADP